MTWLLVMNGRTLARGTYEHVLDRAERAGLLFHVVMVETAEGGVRLSRRMGRDFYPDGIEKPARLERGCAILLDGMAGLARRAAA